jgi:hypothetical protein
MAVDDRRHRPRGLKPGESFQYDDQGMGTYIKRAATFVIGGGKGDGAAQRFASLRHVMKQQQPFPQMGQQQQANGSGGGSSGSSSGQGQQQQDYNHEGENPSSEFQTQNGKALGTAEKIVKHYVGDAWTVAATDHAAAHFGKNIVFVDKNGCWSTRKIGIRQYPYQDDGQMMSGGQGGSGGGGGGG